MASKASGEWQLLMKSLRWLWASEAGLSPLKETHVARRARIRTARAQRFPLFLSKSCAAALSFRFSI
jgi:hypothetical protein